MDVSGLCGGGEEETCWDTAGPRVADLGNNLMEIIFSALAILQQKYMGNGCRKKNCDYFIVEHEY